MSLSFCSLRFGASLQIAPKERFLAETYSRDIRCHAGRRHHRRRPWNLEWDSHDWNKTSVLEKQQPESVQRSTEDKLVITVDFRDFRKRASEAATKVVKYNLQKLSETGNWFISESVKTWQDLRTSVTVQKDARIVIALRSSTLDFIGRATLGLLAIILLMRLFVKLARKYRWGWEEGLDWPGLVRRDRSLGGREVIVSQSGKKNSEKTSLFGLKAKPKIPNPLDGVEASRSERDPKTLSISRKQAEKLQSSRQNLPKWWPKRNLLPLRPSLQAQIEANSMIQAIMNKRLNGADFSEEDMLKIRKTCRESGAKVSFDSSNTRDSFYRVAINFVLLTCSRSTSRSAAPLICNESAVEFIVGLATDIGLDDGRAATMINAAVAARTRSSFVQAWALSLQGNFTGAENEIAKLVQIHAVFCPESNSPEMEMVAKGLETSLDVHERKELLQMYKKIGSGALERVAMEALGLVSLKER